MTGARTRTEETPYPGTRPFDGATDRWFFGRTHESKILAEMWQDNRLTIAAGPAGSGKTSLLQAGVLPLVAQRHQGALPVGRVSYGAPFPAAAIPQHNPYSLALLRSWSRVKAPSIAADQPLAEIPPTRLAGLTISDFIDQKAELQDAPILAVIDQAEELLADPGPRWGHQQRFLADLRGALLGRPQLHLLLMVRDEACGLLTKALGSGATLRVSPLTHDGAFDAVTRPAAAAGRSFAAGAAERLLSDLATSRIALADQRQRVTSSDCIEPALLQIVCARLWASLSPSADMISIRDVRRYASAGVTLAAHCGQVVATIADEHDMSESWLRSWLLNTFVTADGTRKPAYEGTADTAGMTNAVVRALEDQHILSASAHSGSRWYELLADRLIEPLRQAVTTEPLPVAPGEYLEAAGRALSLGDPDAAERYAGHALEVAGQGDRRRRALATSLLGNIELERDKPAAAEPRYKEAAALFGAVQDTRSAAYQLAAAGQALFTQGRLSEAREQLEVADNHVHDSIVKTELGRVLWQLGDARAAVAVLTDALGLDSGNREALRARGEILADLGDASSAILDLNRVGLENRPSTRAARALALGKLGDYRTARQEVRTAITEAPQNGLALLYAARAAELTGDREAVADLARRAMDATDPGLMPHHRFCAERLLAAGQVRSPSGIAESPL